MTNFVSQHHSFDIHLAEEFGIEEAILIHHFQHWIRVNRRLKRNFRENRTWSYQTQKEMQAHFPYLKLETVKYALEQLIEKKVLIRKNFNKNPIDKTWWYAFVDEDKFINSNNFYDTENSVSTRKIPPPIPDTINPDTKTYNNKPNPNPTKQPQSPKLKQWANDFLSFLNRIRESLGVYALDSSAITNNWHKELQRIRSKISLDDYRSILTLLEKDAFWRMVVTNPAKLRKNLDSFQLKLAAIKNSPAAIKQRKHEELEAIATANRQWWRDKKHLCHEKADECQSGLWINKRLLCFWDEDFPNACRIEFPEFK